MSPSTSPDRRRYRGRLFRKYVAAIAGLVATLLVVHGAVTAYARFDEQRASLIARQQEEARDAASRIDSFIAEMVDAVRRSFPLPQLADLTTLEQRRIDSLRVLREVASISELVYVDGSDREQLHLSNSAANVVAGGADRAHDPMVARARAAGVWVSPVFTVDLPQPHLTIAIAEDAPAAGVAIVSVDIASVVDVVVRHRLGDGYAYVVDPEGRLIAHHDLALVLRETDMWALPQVSATLERGTDAVGALDAFDLQGRPVLSAGHRVESTGWWVFIDTPLDVALSPVIASIGRSAAILGVGLLLAVLASFVLARQMVTPVRALQDAVARISDGRLEERIAIGSGDELEALGNDVERMARAVAEREADLERARTDAQQAALALEHQALHDPLTGLPNRALLDDRLAQEIVRADRASGSVALLVIDLDRFKDVNDTFGHPTGDQLLREVGKRLLPLVRPSDTVARLGGDEFAVLVPGVDEVRALEIARQVVREASAPFDVEGRSLLVGASVGIALAPRDGRDAAVLMRHADVAMYEAKRSGNGPATYAADRDANDAARLELTGELRSAIERGELVLHYQPQVSLRDGRLVRFEGLVRWQHPRRGLVMPGEFIPLAEQTGLIRPLGEAVVRLAASQIAEWGRRGHRVQIAINLSMRNLADPEIAARVATILAEQGVDPSLLVLEITESAIMSDPERVIRTVAELGARGSAIAIDDFGIGYSSLAYLDRLAVDELKIDRSFVEALRAPGGSGAIVRAATELGKALGLEVVAEGVEDEATAEQLRALGCHTAQGYVYSRPLPAAGAEAWFEPSRTPASAPTPIAAMAAA